MSPQDKAIWFRYLLQGGNIFAPFVYDLRVGEGAELPPGSSATDYKVAQALTTKRIDVLWTTPTATVICEVKRRAGAGAIGQLLLYRQLYMTTFPTSQPVKMFLVTDELQPDVEVGLFANDIDYHLTGL